MRKIIILNYHRISNDYDDYNFTNVSESNFLTHIEYLSNKYDFIRIDDLLDDKVFNGDRDAVAITFDDGYYNVYKCAVPILKKYNVPATCFISTENIDTNKENWTDILVRAIFQPCCYKEQYSPQDSIFKGTWNADSLENRLKLYRVLREMLKISNKAEREQIIADICNWGEIPFEARESRRIVSSKQLVELDRNKNITIGAHTVSHPFLASLSSEEIENEVIESKKTLESIVDHTVDYFAYPFGDYSDETRERLITAGYKMVFDSGARVVTPDTDKMHVPRYSMKNYGKKEFENFLTRTLDQTSVQEREVHLGCYIGSLSEDYALMTSNKNIIICGAGSIGQCLFEHIIKYVNEARIYAFEDQDRRKQGLVIMDRMVVSIDSLEGHYNDFIYVVRGWYAKEKFRVLRKLGCRYIHVME